MLSHSAGELDSVLRANGVGSVFFRLSEPNSAVRYVLQLCVALSLLGVSRLRESVIVGLVCNAIVTLSPLPLKPSSQSISLPVLVPSRSSEVVQERTLQRRAIHIVYPALLLEKRGTRQYN